MRKLTPMRAIRAKCLDCCCGSATEVRLCEIRVCPLYPYKSGHKPKEDSEEYKLITNSSLPENIVRRYGFGEKEHYLQGGDEE